MQRHPNHKIMNLPSLWELVPGYRSPSTKSVFSSEKLVLQAIFDGFSSKTPLFYENSRSLYPFLVFIVISSVLPMRFLECITSRYENFLMFPCILRCFRVFYAILMKNGKKWQNTANRGG